MVSRRGFLGGLIASLAAPAIIRTPGLLMPVRPVVLSKLTFADFDRIYLEAAVQRMADKINDEILYGTITTYGHMTEYHGLPDYRIMGA